MEHRPSPRVEGARPRSLRAGGVAGGALLLASAAGTLGAWAVRAPMPVSSPSHMLDDVLARGAAATAAGIGLWWALGILGLVLASVRPRTRFRLAHLLAGSLPSPVRTVMAAALGAVVVSSVVSPAVALSQQGAGELVPVTTVSEPAGPRPAGLLSGSGADPAWGASRTTPLAPGSASLSTGSTERPGSHGPGWAPWLSVAAAEPAPSGDTSPSAGVVEASGRSAPSDGSPQDGGPRHAPSAHGQAAEPVIRTDGRATAVADSGSTPSGTGSAPSGGGSVPVSSSASEPRPAGSSPDPAAAGAGSPASSVDPAWTPSRPAEVRQLPDSSDVLVKPPRTLGDAGAEIVVRRGDTLWDLCARHLPPGATDAEIAAEWPRWYESNRDVLGSDPDHIEPGQRLRPPGPARG